jgi:hypothetical protein
VLRAPRPEGDALWVIDLEGRTVATAQGLPAPTFTLSSVGPRPGVLLRTADSLSVGGRLETPDELPLAGWFIEVDRTPKP